MCVSKRAMHVYAVLTCALIIVGCKDKQEEIFVELQDKSPVIRAGALKTLATQDSDEAYLLVTRFLEDPSAIVRISAVQALHLFKKHDTTVPIIRASADRDPEVRSAAVLALGERQGVRATRALVKMLIQEEKNIQVRNLIYDSLRSKGLSGESLSHKIADAQISIARKQFANASPTERVRAVEIAGRSIHPKGIDLVLEGLADSDQDVVITAIRVLDKRGGKKALSHLVGLLADPVEAIRLAAIRALPDFGKHALNLLEGSLQDPSSKVRCAAIQEISHNNAKVTPSLLCKLVLDKDPQVSVLAARFIRTNALNCNLKGVKLALTNANGKRYRNIIQALGEMGGQNAIELLKYEFKNNERISHKVFLLASLVRAGDSRAIINRELVYEFNRRMDEIDNLLISWVGDELAQKHLSEQPNGTKAKLKKKGEKELSDDELRELFENYGLPPPDKDSPRSVADILMNFPTKESAQASLKLFNPITDNDITNLCMLLDALLRVRPDKAGTFIQRMLSMKTSAGIGKVARVLLAHNVVLEWSKPLLGVMSKALENASTEDTRAIVDLLCQSGDKKVVPILVQVMKRAPWEKREFIIHALGELGSTEAKEPLIALLAGYSAASAAHALAKIKDTSAIEPLEVALDRVGPVEEIEVLTALAHLGSKKIIPCLEEKLNHVNPEIRCAAVCALSNIDDQKTRQALERARYDPDRLVRKEVYKALIMR